jgi:hypothetical protein
MLGPNRNIGVYPPRGGNRGPNGAPNNLVATVYNDTRIDAACDINATNADGISWEYSSDAGAHWTVHGTSLIGTYSYTSLIIDTIYSFRCRNFKGTSFSAYSNIDIEATMELFGLDYMEYASDAIIQATYITSDTGVSGWTQKAPQSGTETQARGLVVLNDELYAGSVGAGQLLKWNGTNAWTVMAPKLGAETVINSMVVFNGKIYGGTASLAKLYEWNGVDGWASVAARYGSETYINDLCIYNNKLYGCTELNAYLLEWNGTDTWVAKAHNNGTGINCLCVFNGKLYGGSTNGKLLEWNDADTWVEKATISGAEVIKSMAVFKGKLYGGTNSLAKLLEWNGTNAWVEKAGRPGTETYIMDLIVYNNKLYGSSWGAGLLLEWNETDAWVQRCAKLNAETIVLSLCEFNNKLYGGTFNNGNLFEWGLNLNSRSEATIKTQGSYSLLGTALITDSLNKTLTKTLSPTKNLTGVAQILFSIRSTRTGSNIKIGIHDSGGTTTEITPNITSANAFQSIVWDISAVSNANKDAIDSIIITIVNADAANTFYIDNIRYISSYYQKDAANLIAISGQSNAIGYFPTDGDLPIGYAGAQSNIWINFNQITGADFQVMNPAVNCGYDWFADPDDNTGWGAEQSLAHGLLTDTGKDVLVVKTGAESSGIALWDAGQPFYDELVAGLVKVLNNYASEYSYERFNNISLLWMQGEYDAVMDYTTAYYEAKMRSVISRLRASDSRLANIKIVMVKLPSFMTYLTATQRGRINTAFTNIIADTTYTYLLDPDTLAGAACYVSAPPSADNLHYTSATMLLIGTEAKRLITT